MYKLSDEIAFPHPQYASPEGLLAIGGDLSPERILFAYEHGIFPWFNEEDPILWWSPDPRLILVPSEIKISKSMKRILQKGAFKNTFDQDFEAVIKNCSAVARKEQYGTWLSSDMQAAYLKLHQLGFAHSVETWLDGELVGGLYGLSMGKCFFGESMFAKTSNASKAALIYLAQSIQKFDFKLIDCQTETSHLTSMGAKLIEREKFMKILEKNKEQKTILGSWKNLNL